LLEIGRMNTTYLVPRAHPAPEEVRSELDRAAGMETGLACERALSAMLDPGDPSIWLIRKLRVNLLMDPGGGWDRAAEFWGERIADSIMRTIARGADGDSVLHFRTRADYLAWLLGELAWGREWTRQHAREFGGLRPLPFSAVVVSALSREPELADEIVLAMDGHGALGRISALLSLRDARQVLDLCGERADAASLDRTMAGRALAALRDGETLLAVYAALRRADSLEPAIVRAAVWLADALEGLPAPAASALAGGNLAAAVRSAATAEQRDAILAAHCIAADSEWLAETFTAAETASDAVEAGKLYASDYAGVFLLLPSIAELFPKLDSRGCYRLLLHCSGGAEAERGWRERALADASGLAEMPDTALLADSGPCPAVESDGTEPLEFYSLPNAIEGVVLSNDLEWSVAAAAVMRRLARSLTGLGRASAPYLWANVLGGGAMVTAGGEQIKVRLAPRPLQIILRMAGFNGLTVSPSWLGGRVVTIEFPE